MKKLLFIGVLFIISCKESTAPVDNSTMYYTIEAQRQLYEIEYKKNAKKLHEKDSSADIIPTIPLIYDNQYYSNYNFIIDSLNHIYYFYHSRAYEPVFCGTGMEFGPFPAPYIKLYPKDIIHIPDSDFETFFRSRVMDSIKPKESILIYIGSQKDSFKSPQIDKLYNIFNTDHYYRAIVCRKTTEQEDVLLQYKKSGKYYNPDEIKWDSTKTDIKSIK
ncbi:hypothetical protein [Flavobacterium beibuense]|uniref:Lipoprotein n=1 Tax=Flavobacterium beibuense TaxID=657326 RepID=A0A444W9E0_9FLAO|nr:hypothetical protein [Flavobacterium beibuense]RYJ42519.1 hypothetical protein NU09_2305 [Flavobacterium beibuense]